jgi:DNA-binding response OmpR family regulator
LKRNRDSKGYDAQYFGQKGFPLVTKTSTRTILIVEDDPDAAEFAQFTLQQAGYRTLVDNVGTAALQLPEVRHGIDLVLLDVMLPGIDGFKICNRLKSVPSTEFLPIVMLTAKRSQEDVLYGMVMAEADAYLKKPTGPEALLKTVSKLLTKKKKKKAR